MRKILFTLAVLIFVSDLLAQPISRLPETNSVVWSNTIPVVVNPRRTDGYGTWQIGISNLLESLLVLPNFPVFGGEVSTAQLLVVSNQMNTASNALRTDVSNLQGGTNGLNARVGVLETLAETAITNNHTVSVTINSNLTITGSITNNNTNAATVIKTKSIQRDNGGNARGFMATDFQFEREGEVTAVAGGNYSFIGGGRRNINTSSPYSFIGNGKSNQINFGEANFLGAGIFNDINLGGSTFSFLGAGIDNEVDFAEAGFVGGGTLNDIGDRAGGVPTTNSFIGGGLRNNILASRSSVLGGSSNVVSGLGSTAIGNQLNNPVAHSVVIGEGNGNRLHVGPNGTTNIGGTITIPSATAQTFAVFDGNKGLSGTIPTNSFATHAQLTTASNQPFSGTIGGAVTLDASGFNGNLATTDNTLQEVAQKFDDFTAGAGNGTMTTIRSNSAVVGTNLVAILTTNANVASPVEAQWSSNAGVATVSYEVKNLSGSGNIVASNAPTLNAVNLLGPTTAAAIEAASVDTTADVNAGAALAVGTTANVNGAIFGNTSVITPRLQVGSISNVTHQVGDNWHLNGSSNWYSSEITSNTTAVLTNLFLNTPLFLTVSNRGSFTLDFNVPAAAWRGLNGQAPVLAPNGITKFMFVKEAVGQTNAYILSEPALDLAPGWGQALDTNGNTVSVTMTNRAAGIATNATSATVGFSDSENVQIYNVGWMLVTNLTLSPTNLVVGRTICVYLPTNSLTYDVTITNTAANRVNWNFNVATNGSTSFTKTNTLFARLYLTAETNGVLSAEMGYYR